MDSHIVRVVDAISNEGITTVQATDTQWVDIMKNNNIGRDSRPVPPDDLQNRIIERYINERRASEKADEQD